MFGKQNTVPLPRIVVVLHAVIIYEWRFSASAEISRRRAPVSITERTLGQ